MQHAIHMVRYHYALEGVQRASGESIANEGVEGRVFDTRRVEPRLGGGEPRLGGGGGGGQEEEYPEEIGTDRIQLTRKEHE